MSSSSKTAASIDAVKASLTSGTFSAATLSLYKGLISSSTPSASTTSTQSRTIKATVTKATSGRSRTTKTTTTTASSTSTSSTPTLSKSEKLRLASETVNFCLKALQSAIEKQSKEGDAGKENKDTRKASKAPLTSRAGSSSKTDATSAENIAECCRLSISYLKSAEKAAGMPPLQMEKAQYSLVQKMIALKLYKLALKEARSLKNRLEEHIAESKGETWEGEHAEESETSSQRTTSSAGKRIVRMADIFQFQDIPETSSAATLAAQTQICLLRCIHGLKDPALIEELMPALYPDASVVAFKVSTKEVRHQLPYYNSLFGMLCPSTLPAADSSALDPRLSPSPQTVFKLHILALECKLRQEDHTSDAKTWDSLNKCCVCFLRRSKQSGDLKGRYKLLVKCVQRLYSLRKKGEDQLHADMYPMLATAAEDAGLKSEGLAWLERGVEGDMDGTTRVINSVRLTTMELGESDSLGPSKLARTLASTQKAVSEIQSIKKCSRHSLERLLQEVVFFQRASALAVARNASLKYDHMETLMSATFAAIKFYIKYTDMLPLDSARVRKYTLIAMEHFGGFVRKLDLSQWERVDSLIQDCLELARKLDGSNSMTPEQKAAMSMSMYERISDWYWKLSFLYRKENLKTQEIMAIERSVLCLNDRPLQEAIRCDVLGRRERLANCWLSLGDASSADKTLCEAMDSAVEMGLFAQIEALSRTQPLRRVFDNEATSSLSRLLMSQIALRAQKYKTPESLLVSSRKHSPDLAGIILEWHLKTLTSLSLDTKAHARFIADRLLQTYDHTYPLRRARVVCAIFTAALDDEDFCDKEELINIGALCEQEVKSDNLHNDAGLINYRYDILAQLLVSRALFGYRIGKPSPKFLEMGIDVWKYLLGENRTWEELKSCLEYPEECIDRVQLLADFCDMRGLPLLRISVLWVLVALYRKNTGFGGDVILNTYCQLSLQYCRLGYTGKAEECLKSGEQFMTEESTSHEARVKWHLAYIELNVAVGNVEGATEHFKSATALAGPDPRAVVNLPNRGSREVKIALTRVVAEASYSMSLVAFEKGDMLDAVMHIRRCIRLYQKLWAMLEHLAKTPVSHTDEHVKKLAQRLETLQTAERGEPPIQVIKSSGYAAFNGPLLWSIVSALYAAMKHASSLYRHQGMFKEAEYYLDELVLMAEATNSTPIMAQALSLTGDLRIRSGQVEEGEKLLARAAEFKNELENSRDAVMFQCAVANMHRVNDLLEREVEHYESAERKLERLCDPAFVASLGGDLVEQLTEHLDEMDIDEPEPAAGKKTPVGRGRSASVRSTGRDKTPAGRARTPAKTPTRTPTGRRTPSKGPARASSKGPVKKGKQPPPTKPNIDTDFFALERLRGNILRLKAESLALQGSFDEAEETIKDAAELSVSMNDSIAQKLTMAKNAYCLAIALLGDDPALSALQDSTLSLPNIACSTFGEVDDLPVVKLSKGKVAAGKGAEPLELLCKARDALLEVHTVAVETGSTQAARSVSVLTSSLLVLISALSTKKVEEQRHHGFAGFSLELSKGLSQQREKDAIMAEQFVAENMKDELVWPIETMPRPEKTVFYADNLPLDLASFRSAYIDSLPKEWAAISITLSESKDELFLCRFQAGQDHLVVRLPLTRHNSRDEGEEVFEYADGLTELQEIQKAILVSTHSAKKVTLGGDRSAREEWWTQREELDARLGDLLTNIENCWLSGFKGLLSLNRKDTELITKFRASFERILNKYLPSRQRNAGGGRKGRGGGDKVSVDPRIYDLFVGLGDPSKVDIELPLEDLVYFVIDILQFHGEQNAYDEIEIDSIVCDTTEALRAYHETIDLSTPSPTLEVTTHTILILDKHMNVFPWESLPCLEGQPVSRLPSLSALSNILKHPRFVPGGSSPAGFASSPPGIHLDRDNGAYILNPGCDLTATQNEFEAELKALDTWSGIMARPPIEEEFKHYLERKDILLYFGHGSGGQYIRAKTVKKLDTCAVTLLMGCSSGKLQDAGEFDPYGMPKNYLIGGCPALVSTLWDVTDRDLDRFSKHLLQEWGLFDADSKPVSKSKGKGKKKESSRSRPTTPPVEKREKVSLVEAVASSRDQCKMKYINGAALVVYGVPAYL
ncbi:hypothetical protein BJ508DRAFT_411252 [Ascobolus immersus RN42]|uniref:separase n=1 Tax=Ascobolus immersus RN42 TaxID=1160509 RepID=A0A3N4IKB6_ASCIM|nr:hypothetical protein BJ508DRAFT_411252 [Ascobolus immersus RN42]